METQTKETVTRINGNGQAYTTGLPKLVIQEKWNDVALEHVYANTGLLFREVYPGWLECQPWKSKQIAALFMTYNFKTQYYNNSDFKNTLMLKSDHHIGFKVNSICFECVQHNHIVTNGLNKSDRLAC